MAKRPNSRHIPLDERPTDEEMDAYWAVSRWFREAGERMIVTRAIESGQYESVTMSSDGMMLLTTSTGITVHITDEECELITRQR